MIERRDPKRRTGRTTADDLPWTVARCNRLLRSISSRIATIRRIVDNYETAPDKSLDSPAGTSCNRISNTVLPYLQSPNNQDPEWMPQARKTSSRTYGSKQPPRKLALNRADSSNNGSPALRTPFLRKLLRPTVANSPLVPPAFATVAKKSIGAAEPRRSRQLPIKSASSLDEAQQQLVGALRPFLQSTTPASPPRRKGAGSLRQMCLKQTPQHIEFEQAWLDEQEGETSASATDEIYAYLESLGQGVNPGFTGLRQVVRSHGIRMITNAIADGLIGDPVIRQLMETCKHCDAVTEGQSILSTWAESVIFLRENRPLRNIKMLVSASHEMDSFNFLLRQLAALLDTGKLKSSHIEDADTVWRVLLQKLSSSAGSLDAMTLLEAYALEAATEDRQKQSIERSHHGSVRSVIVLLTAMMWQQEITSETPLGNGTLMWQIQRLLHGVLPHLNSASSLLRPFLLSALIGNAAISQDNAHGSFMDIATLLPVLCPAGTVKSRDEDVDFILEVARVTSHVDTETADEMMRAVVIGLAKAAKGSSARESSAYMKGLAVDSAMAWAELRDDVETYEWAENVESRFLRGEAELHPMQTPASSKMIRFRWEACISEWIQATPFHSIRPGVVSMDKDPDGFEDSGICMPESESPSRKRSRSASIFEDDSDLEERDELAMQTPELMRLRDYRAWKEQRQVSEGEEKESVKPNKLRKHSPQQKRRFVVPDESSEDELGM